MLKNKTNQSLASKISVNRFCLVLKIYYIFLVAERNVIIV